MSQVNRLKIKLRTANNLLSGKFPTNLSHSFLTERVIKVEAQLRHIHRLQA